MGRFCAAVFVCGLFACHSGGSQGSDAGSDAGSDGGYTPTYTPGAKGTEAGTPASKSIDASGGTLSSADGALDLAIPAGALSAATTVTIQPITSTTPSGLWPAFRLTPEGTAFAKPVTLTFHLPAAQVPAIAFAFFVSQHADGLWYAQPGATRDATAGTIAVGASHFSDWGLESSLTLSPATARVPVNQTQFFDVYGYFGENKTVVDDSTGDEVAVPVATRAPPDDFSGPLDWAVNGLPSGSSTLGLVARNVSGDGFARGEYQAPAVVPSPAQLTLSVSMTYEHAGQQRKGVALASVTVYGAETWSGTSSIARVDGAKVDSSFTFEQKLVNGVPSSQFQIRTGSVTFTPPPVVSGNCTETISPNTQTMGAGDGAMQVDTDGGLRIAVLGTTVWSANYHVVCPNNSGDQMLPVEAEWWPEPPGAIDWHDADGGSFTGTVGNQGSSGTVAIHRD
jgi:hypothetical protein